MVWRKIKNVHWQVKSANFVPGCVQTITRAITLNTYYNGNTNSDNIYAKLPHIPLIWRQLQAEIKQNSKFKIKSEFRVRIKVD